MTNMRNTDIEKIGDYKVLTFKDVDKDIVKNMQTGKEQKAPIDGIGGEVFKIMFNTTKL